MLPQELENNAFQGLGASPTTWFLTWSTDMPNFSMKSCRKSSLSYISHMTFRPSGSMPYSTYKLCKLTFWSNSIAGTTSFVSFSSIHKVPTRLLRTTRDSNCYGIKAKLSSEVQYTSQTVVFSGNRIGLSGQACMLETGRSNTLSKCSTNLSE